MIPCGAAVVDTRLVWSAERASLTIADHPPIALARATRERLLLSPPPRQGPATFTLTGAP